MAKRKYVYYAEIERFGYTLNVIGLTEEEARDAITKEYVDAFKKENGKHPSKSIAYGDRTYMDIFNDELCVTKREFGKVAWW